MQRFVVNIKAFFRYSGLAWVVCGKPRLSDLKVICYCENGNG